MNNIIEELHQDGREGVGGVLKEFSLKLFDFHGLP